MPIIGSNNQVLRHAGHFPGLTSLSSEKVKPHALQRAGSMVT